MLDWDASAGRHLRRITISDHRCALHPDRYRGGLAGFASADPGMEVGAAGAGVSFAGRYRNITAGKRRPLCDTYVIRG